jgi:hypothetical protein
MAPAKTIKDRSSKYAAGEGANVELDDIHMGNEHDASSSAVNVRSETTTPTTTGVAVDGDDKSSANGNPKDDAPSSGKGMVDVAAAAATDSGATPVAHDNTLAHSTLLPAGDHPTTEPNTPPPTAAAPAPATLTEVMVHDESRELVQRHNTSFCSMVDAYYCWGKGDLAETKKYIFLGVLCEYLKIVNADLYRIVFKSLCTDIDSIKSVVTVDIWERVSAYVTEYIAHKKKNTSAAAVTTTTNRWSSHDPAAAAVPQIFTVADWPSLPKSSGHMKRQDGSSPRDESLAVLHVSCEGVITGLDRAKVRDLSLQESSISKTLATAMNKYLRTDHGTAASSTVDGRKGGSFKVFKPPARLEFDDGVANDLEWQGFFVAKLPHKLDVASTAVPNQSATKMGHIAGSIFVSSDSGTSSTKLVKPKGKGDEKPKKRKHKEIAPEDKVFLDGEPTEVDVRFGRGGATNHHVSVL